MTALALAALIALYLLATLGLAIVVGRMLGGPR